MKLFVDQIVFWNKLSIELYNLKDDIGESNNLALVETVKREELLNDLVQWQLEIEAPLPADPNTEYNPIF